MFNDTFLLKNVQIYCKRKLFKNSDEKQVYFPVKKKKKKMLIKRV